MKEDYLICDKCGSKMLLGYIEGTICSHGRHKKFTGVEAYRCTECGQIVYSRDGAKKLEKLLTEDKVNE